MICSSRKRRIELSSIFFRFVEPMAGGVHSQKNIQKMLGSLRHHVVFAQPFVNALPHCALKFTTIVRAKTNKNDTYYEFTYQGSDGRLKATFEQAFKAINANDTVPPSPSASQAPWELGYQMSEKNLAWNDDLKSRLLSRVAADRLQLSDEELEERLTTLTALLPDISSKLAYMHPDTLVRMLSTIETLPAQLMALKETFPDANVSKLALRAPELVLDMPPDLVQSIAARLHELLPTLNIDKLVEENPSMLDVEELQVAIAEAQRLMPSLDVVKSMGSDPQMILSFQRGSQLIPYDPPTPVSEQDGDGDNDDEYAQYYH